MEGIEAMKTLKRQINQQINLIGYLNDYKLENTINRRFFACLEISIPREGNWMKRVMKYADEIKGDLNPGQANNSKKRSPKTVEIDNRAGVIAEYACDTILRWQFGDSNIFKSRSSSSMNQIDIELITGKTIEVRSSCVRNGIDFAIFNKDVDNCNQQYFDVIGPYSNAYKPGEYLKDYYMRVLYHCDKNDFMNLLNNITLQLFITGGATKAMMQDPNVYQNKHLTPAGGQVQIESDYRVVPLGNSLDVFQFFNVISEENGLVGHIDFR